MPNPALNDKVFKEAAAEAAAEAGPSEAEAGWAAPAAETANTIYHEPITDGPISPYTSIRTGLMTVGGTAAATGVLLVVLCVAAVFGWNFVTVNPSTTEVNFPGWLLLPLFAALGVGILTAFKPKLARFTAPLYAILQGIVVGAISHVYDAQWNGIVLQAIGATIAVFAVMLALYGLRIIRVTDRFRRIVIGATFGILLLYGVSALFALFGHTPSFLYDSSLFGIALSVFIAGVAAFNLALDFDLIERGVKAGAPRYMEWYGAFGLLVTLVWLYLEILRLLARLRSR
jgi:uncharacterized YccA/Bax inhibitor family protein